MSADSGGVDTEKYHDLSDLIADVIMQDGLSEANQQTVIEYCQKAIINDILKQNTGSRPPRLYLFGRSGAGKSSLINALCDEEVTDVGTVKPTTVSSKLFEIELSQLNTKWHLVDSRGLFESVPADGGVSVDTVKKLKTDLESYCPDILLHVMTPEQARAGEDDFAAIEELDDAIVGSLPPRVTCINKVDTFLSLGGDWPPEGNEKVQQRIIEVLDLVTEILPVYRHEDIDPADPARGRLFGSNRNLGAIPLYVKEKPYWNLKALADLFYYRTRNSTILGAAQTQRKKRVMRRLSRKQTIQMAEEINEVPRKLIVDPRVPIVTELESLLIALIGAFAGRKLHRGTVEDYHRSVDMSLGDMVSTASGVTTDAITGLFKQDLNYIRNNFYCVGRSAEVFFFDDKIIDPDEFTSEAKQYFQQN